MAVRTMLKRKHILTFFPVSMSTFQRLERAGKIPRGHALTKPRGKRGSGLILYFEDEFLTKTGKLRERLRKLLIKHSKTLVA